MDGPTTEVKEPGGFPRLVPPQIVDVGEDPPASSVPAELGAAVVPGPLPWWAWLALGAVVGYYFAKRVPLENVTDDDGEE